MSRTVTLVSIDGTPIGTADLVDAHTGEGKLHKAFSVYVFRKNRSEILIQQRSTQKMLWPGIWANTCCSHPVELVTPQIAGERRLKEELGFTCPLTPVTNFVYRAEDPLKRGVEHEHVTILRGDDPAGEVKADPAEVMAYTWMPIPDLQKDMNDHPDHYAPWFHQGLKILLSA